MGMDKKFHVLLVEDNPADTTLLEELLEQGNYHVAMYCTNNGYDAFDFLNRHSRYERAPRPNVVLLDLGLPRMNGYEMLSRVRKVPNLARIPIIVLTTSRDPKDRELCMSLGAYDFISKPYDLDGYEVLVDHLASNIFPSISQQIAS